MFVLLWLIASIFYDYISQSLTTTSYVIKASIVHTNTRVLHLRIHPRGLGSYHILRSNAMLVVAKMDSLFSMPIQFQDGLEVDNS
jgi:hypothetical protein